MQISQSFEYPASLERIVAMYSDPEYTKARLAQPGVLDPVVEITESQGTTTITAKARIDVTTLPSAAQRFVKSGLSVRLTETWGPVKAGVRTGTTDIHVEGAPVKAHATSTLRDRGSATTRQVEGEFSVSIPLVGRTVEQKAAGRVGMLFDAEVNAAKEWLAAHCE